MLAMGLGGVLGYERNRHGRAAGLRTHAIVALASALFMVVSVSVPEMVSYGPTAHASADVERIAGGVVMGIGFLAGGAILRAGPTVQGLTTAAGMWLVAAIGLASGIGLYGTAVGAGALGLVALSALRRLESRNETFGARRVSVTLAAKGTDALLRLRSRLAASGASLSHERYVEDLEKGLLTASFEIRFPSEHDGPTILALMRAEPNALRVEIEGTS